MVTKVAAAAVGMFLLVAVPFGCSSQQASQSSGGTQVASAGAAQKCELDAKKICQEMRNQEVSVAGQMQGSRETEENQPRTMSETITYQIPNGSLLEIECQINTTHRSVVYARTLQGPALTPTDVAFIQQAGYCVH
jgi:hypothetical protein